MEETKRRILEWIADRLNEPTTWHGLNALCTVIGMTLKPELIQAVISLGAAVSSVILVVTKEKK